MWVFLPGLVIEFAGIVILVAGLLADSTTGVIAGGCVIAVAVAVHIFQIAKNLRSNGGAAGAGKPPSSPRPAAADDPTVLYADHLVTITGSSITFANYSLLMRPRCVAFADIDHIDVLEPSIYTGKYRMWGSGNFTMWFPMDAGRSSRDKIYHAHLNTRGMNIGFTVENSAVVTAILRSKGLVRS